MAEHESLIVKDRLRRIAREQGKTLSSEFLDYLNNELHATLEAAIHMLGDRKLVKSEEFIKYQALLRGAGVSK